MIYVEVEDLQATLDKAESLGGKTTMPIMEIPGMVTLAHFSDPDGNVIGIVKSAELRIFKQYSRGNLRQPGRAARLPKV